MINDLNEIEYNEEFDKENYPLTQYHLDSFNAVLKAMYLPSSRLINKRYSATIQSSIFTANYGQGGIGKRVYSEHIKELVKLEFFRWIELDNQSISFSIRHPNAAERKHG